MIIELFWFSFVSFREDHVNYEKYKHSATWLILTNLQLALDFYLYDMIF